jgi:hypothetical protein
MVMVCISTLVFTSVALLRAKKNKHEVCVCVCVCVCVVGAFMPDTFWQHSSRVQVVDHNSASRQLA